MKYSDKIMAGRIRRTLRMISLLFLGMSFCPVDVLAGDPYDLKPTTAEVQHPERVFTNDAGNVVVDFGKDAFGWFELSAPAAGLEYFINIGEVLWEENGIRRKRGFNVCLLLRICAMSLMLERVVL